MKLSKITNLIICSAASLALVSCITPAAPQAPTPVVPTFQQSAGGLPIANPVLDEAGQPKKNLFISPYKPFNPIDTSGFKSGDVVGDPSTAKLSEKTGKPMLTTSKTFKIP